MTQDTLSLEFLARQSKLQMEEMRELRKDMANMMALLNATYEQTRRAERRHMELRDDIEVMVKMELGGTLANMKTSLETSLARIEETVGDVVQRVDILENKF